LEKISSFCQKFIFCQNIKFCKQTQFCKNILNIDKNIKLVFFNNQRLSFGPIQIMLSLLFASLLFADAIYRQQVTSSSRLAGMPYSGKYPEQSQIILLRD
jgi:hypothetical protein